jgi:hypothetical protein
MVLNAADAVGKLGTIFHGAELTLRVRVVIGNVRTAMVLGHSQVGQEDSNRLGAHRGAAVGMQSELTATGGFSYRKFHPLRKTIAEWGVNGGAMNTPKSSSATVAAWPSKPS